MSKLTKEYIDDTCGIKPAPNQDSFNNIIFTVWYAVAEKINKPLQTHGQILLKKHLINTDDNGFYKPKNSHDNLSYKLAASKIFGYDYEKRLNPFIAALEIGVYRVWDIIFYCFVSGNKTVRSIANILMFIPCLQMIETCANSGKIRPALEKRWKWWFFGGKKLTKEESNVNMTIKHWTLKDGSEETTRHMLNDGKHITCFKLYAFQDDHILLKWTAKICHILLVNKYGEEYMYKMIKQYFIHQEHPDIEMWKGIKNFLEK